MQNKLTDFQLLPDSEGKVVEAGWAEKPVFEYQPRNIKLERMNIREWDSYILISSSGDYAFTMHLSDKRAQGQVSACFYDIKNRVRYDCFNPKFLHGGKITLSKKLESGSSVVKGLFCDFMYLVNCDDRHLYCKYSKVFDAEIEANIHVKSDLSSDFLSVLIPMNEDMTQFYLNQMALCMPADGYVCVNSERFEFNPQSDFAVLDWGRGVWSDKCRRTLCVGGGLVEGKKFGFSIGCGLGNTDAATQNAFFYEGVCHKLGNVNIGYSLFENGKTATLSDEDCRFEMKIDPVYCFENEHDMPVFRQSENVMFGRMSGTAVTNDGQKIKIRDLICYFEQSTGKY